MSAETVPTYWFHDVMDMPEYHALLGLTLPFDKVAVIRRPDEDRTASGLYKPDQAKEKTTEGVVVGWGDKCEYLGKAVAGHGTKIVFGVFAGTDVPEFGKNAIIMREEEILAFHKIGSERPKLAPPLPEPKD